MPVYAILTSSPRFEPHHRVVLNINQPKSLNFTDNTLSLSLQSPFQHESLLMDRKDLKLTKAEKKAAKKSYEDEKRASVPYQRPSYAHYYPATEQSLSNIRNWSAYTHSLC